VPDDDEDGQSLGSTDSFSDPEVEDEYEDDDEEVAGEGGSDASAIAASGSEGAQQEGEAGDEGSDATGGYDSSYESSFIDDEGAELMESQPGGTQQLVEQELRQVIQGIRGSTPASTPQHKPGTSLSNGKTVVTLQLQQGPDGEGAGQVGSAAGRAWNVAGLQAGTTQVLVSPQKLLGRKRLVMPEPGQQEEVQPEQPAAPDAMEVDLPGPEQQGPQVELVASDDDLTQGPAGAAQADGVFQETQVDQPSLASTEHLVDVDMQGGAGQQAEQRHAQQEQQASGQQQAGRPQHQEPSGLHAADAPSRFQAICSGDEVQVSLTPPSVQMKHRLTHPNGGPQAAGVPSLPRYALWSLAKYTVDRRGQVDGQWVLKPVEPVSNPGVITSSVVSMPTQRMQAFMCTTKCSMFGHHVVLAGVG
jgi:hypothetical protein